MNNHILRCITLKNKKQLQLRKPMVEDAIQIIEYLNQVGGETDHLLFGAGEMRLTVEQESNYIKEMNQDEHALMILGIIDEQIVSISQIACSKRKRIHHNCDIALSVKKDYWHMGIGSAVMEELIRFAKEHSVIKNVRLGVSSRNANAIRLYQKYGFKEIGIYKDYFNVDGHFFDELLMDLQVK